MQIDGSVALVTGANRGLGRVAEVTGQCPDVSLLINNAGVLKYSTFINAPSLEAARAEMKTNYFGTLSMCRAFAPVLHRHRHGRPGQ